MTDTVAIAAYQASLVAVEPAVRVVPARALRRAIRQSRDRGTFRPRAVHDQSWWVRRDELFSWLSPAELGLSENEPPELLLIPAPEARSPHLAAEGAWRALFHAVLDRELNAAFRDGRLNDDVVRRVRRDVGPARWQMIRTVLFEENLIDETDPDDCAFREFVAFGLELVHFRPSEWDSFFPGLSPTGEPLRTASGLLDVAGRYERTRPRSVATESAPSAVLTHVHVAAPLKAQSAVAEVPSIASWVKRGNDLKAAVLLIRTGDPRSHAHLDHLIERLAAAIELDESGRRNWSAVVQPLLEPASRGGWPVERRFLYELQRACLAIERTHYAADMVEWVRTFGRRPQKRPLPKTRWLEAGRRLRAAQHYARRLPGGHHANSLVEELLSAAIHAIETRARDDLRADLIAVLDEVGLVAESVPEQRSREKLVEELLDAACARGFLRIGDLRDAIARSRVKLPDLRGPGELLRGDPLIQANEKLSIRLDGVYRRGEVYMRLLQRGCSLFFGTRPGRWFSQFVALPFGGAFILLEALGHLYDAAEGVLNWLSGWTGTVSGVGLLGGGAASTLANNPTLDDGGVRWEAVLGVGVFLLLMLHWPAFRARFIGAAQFAFVKVPRAIRRSPLVWGLVHNRATRSFRRYLLLPTAAGTAAAVAVWLLGVGPTSVGLVAGGTALLAGTFFRTPFGRDMEDRFDEGMERVWRVVSVNFVVGLLTLILHFFQAIFEAIDRAIHAVDEWLRFREGESRGAFAFKLLFGAGWFVFTYLFRFAWNLLVEPQVNPIKHFPVVTVSHKILLPMVPSLAKQFGIPEKTMWSIVFGIPGIFGFLVWELKENWKLYRANAAKGIRPIQVGSHGETVRRLLRPGFHSGTLPKAFTKLRRALRAGGERRIAKYRHAIEHIAESVSRVGDRSFVAYLRTSSRWGGCPAALGTPELGPNRILLPIEIGDRQAPVRIALEERHGWIIGSIADAAGLSSAGPVQRAAFADALLGLYKRAGVHVVREQVAAVFGPQAYWFDAVPEGLVIPLPDGKEWLVDSESGPEIELPDRRLPTQSIMLGACPLPWADWVARWEADAAGKAPIDPVIPGWSALPSHSDG